MIIAVDFDGTCVTHEFPKVGKDIGAAPILKNLNPKEIEYYNTILDSWNNPKGVVPDVVRPKYSLEFKDFFIPLQECIDRDSKRPNPIGEEVIRKTYEKYKDILECTV